MGLFDRLNRSGITIVIVTHDQNVANFARRIITLSDGFLIEDTVQENPSNARDMLRRVASRAPA
jgi:putative ABC transport system ATP-binding protein